MPVRVELIEEAVEDLACYADSGNLPLFLGRLLRLEEAGKDAGVPLGRNLAGWRKFVVGNRNWRIVFRMNADESVATVWVIGDRDDDACYDEAVRRIAGKAGDDAFSAACCASQHASRATGDGCSITSFAMERSSPAYCIQRRASASCSGSGIQDVAFPERLAQDAPDDVATPGELVRCRHDDGFADRNLPHRPADFDGELAAVDVAIHHDEQVDVAV